MHPKTTVLLIFLICILMQSCSSEHPKDMDSNQNPFEHITLVDTFTNPLEPHYVKEFKQIKFTPLYIGNDTSQIFVEYKYLYETTFLEDFGMTPRSQRSVLTGRTIKRNPLLTIYVDTSRHIGTYRNDIPPPPPRPGYESTDSSWFYWKPKPRRNDGLNYPVFVKNNSEEGICIGFASSLELAVEAQNEEGTWIAINHFPTGFCGNGLAHYNLRSQQIALTSCPVYAGNYRTKLRLVYDPSGRRRLNPGSYSNEFEGSVDYDLIHYSK